MHVLGVLSRVLVDLVHVKIVWLWQNFLSMYNNIFKTLTKVSKNLKNEFIIIRAEAMVYLGVCDLTSEAAAFT